MNSAIWCIQRDKALAEHLLKQTNKMGQIRKPSLCLDAINFPPDVLHMRRAVYAKLLDHVMVFAIGQQKENAVVQEMDRIGIKFRLVLCYVTCRKLKYM